MEVTESELQQTLCTLQTEFRQRYEQYAFLEKNSGIIVPRFYFNSKDSDSVDGAIKFEDMNAQIIDARNNLVNLSQQFCRQLYERGSAERESVNSETMILLAYGFLRVLEQPFLIDRFKRFSDIIGRISAGSSFEISCFNTIYVPSKPLIMGAVIYTTSVLKKIPELCVSLEYINDVDIDIGKHKMKTTGIDGNNEISSEEPVCISLTELLEDNIPAEPDEHSFEMKVNGDIVYSNPPERK